MKTRTQIRTCKELNCYGDIKAHGLCVKHYDAEYRAKKKRDSFEPPKVASDTQSFVRRARIVHGKGKYDYSYVKYVSTHEKVKIRCVEHGIFEQSPSNHLRGYGCRDCGNKSNNN